MKILALVLGGTPEKVYGLGAGVRDLSFPNYPGFEKYTVTNGLFQKHGVEDYSRVLCPLDELKDSLDITDDDRTRVVGIISTNITSGGANRFLVIHGSDSMVETAEYLGFRVSEPATVVLTSSLQPYVVKDSDFEFNLGGAIVATKMLPPGVYIVMHGNIFRWNECRKNPETGQFERHEPFYATKHP